ncbi:hypothetical protein [Novosphingopyxis sp.]|uniref:hypothetical protein n=1 Tax=Novosphingopyxis sp. TaxID=2709690 RepID=UPI003B5B8002
MKILLLATAALLGACAPLATAAGPAAAGGTSASNIVRDAALDALAERYVKLELAIGTQEEGYIDAYYGPPGWQVEAVADPGTKAELLVRTVELRSAIRAAAPADAPGQRRAAWLAAQLTAAETRLRMMMGEKFSFLDEAQGLFGVRPDPQPLAGFDPILEEIDALVPGEGDLAARVDAFQQRFVIAPDRLKPVMDRAIAECRARTAAHIALPPGESFDLEFVGGKPWSGYNYYKGGFHSLIQVNTDLPIGLSRAIDLGCHEGYPGHHVLNSLLEQRLANARGWVEFSVYPLYSPQSLIAEGSANYGIELAFPGVERLNYERDTLYPLAGLDPAGAGPYWALQIAMRALSGARLTIAQQYLDGQIDRAEAVRLTQKYQLVSRAGAEKAIDFTETYRSYILNYGLGMDMVQASVEAGDPSEDEMWRRFEAIISEPTLPGDL